MTRKERRANLRDMDQFVEHLDKAGSLKDAGPDAIGEPGVFIMQMQHDDWCPLLHGGERCVCRPTHRLMKVESAEDEA